VTPDAKLSQVVRACRIPRWEASHALDQLIADGLVSARHPWLVRIFGPPMWFIVGAERYSLTKDGLWQVAQEPESES